MSEIDKAREFGASRRASIIRSIKEYDALVHQRSRNISSLLLDSDAVTAVESVLTRFADDAVNSTFGVVWNNTDIPFSIVDRTDPEKDLGELAVTLSKTLDLQKTGFKSALRHVLRCYLEYGSGWVYAFKNSKGDGISHRVFSVKEIARRLDIYRLPDLIHLDRGNDAYTTVKKTSEGKYDVSQKNINEELKSGSGLDFNPIQELSLTGKYDDTYPYGYGLKALSDLKRYDNIVRSLTSAAGSGLTPNPYISSGVNVANKGQVQHTQSQKINPLIVDSAIGDKIFPVGYIPIPISSVDAWRVFELAAVNIRESFSFINRLMTIKDDADMTATEASIRSQADLSQIRDTVEAIFSFLSELHRVQLFLLRDTPSFKEWEGINPLDLDFYHTSIFKKQFDAEKVREISTGLEIGAKTVQFGMLLQQSGLTDVVDVRKILMEIADTTKLALASGQQDSALVSLLQNLTGE